MPAMGSWYISEYNDSMQEYERTGYVWEQYDAVTGEGKRRSVARCTHSCAHADFDWL